MKSDRVSLEQAARWFSAQRRGALSVEERARLQAWQAEPRHGAALESMHRVWDELSALKNMAGARALLPTPCKSQVHAERKAWPLALAAGLLLAVSVGVWWQGALLAILAPVHGPDGHR